jgi:archaemetzincin
LSKYITICPIGDVDDVILEHLADSIASRCDLCCKVSPGMENPAYAYNDRRCQYDSKEILKHLIQCRPTDTLRFIGVTHVDLYVPILKYVFGLAQIDGTCAVISLHRLHPQFYDQPYDINLLLARTEKTALHELGHTVGLVHCRDRGCIMYSSTRIEDTDYKQAFFCPTCLELFRWHLEKFLS